MPPPGRAQDQLQVIRQYYIDNDFVLSGEGILKIISSVACLVWAGALAAGAGCGSAAGAPALAWDAALALAAGAALALLHAGVACRLPLCAPAAWLYTELVVSAAAGALCLVLAARRLAACERASAADYLQGPLGVVSAALVLASAALQYAAVMRRWDRARPVREPRRAPPTEQDV